MNELQSTTTLASDPRPILPPEASKRRKLKVIVIGPNGGGVRKTKTALVLGSVATAAGYTVIYVCGDRGIGSLSSSLKTGGPNRVELLPDEETNTYAASLLALCEVENADLIIIDLGANEMLNSKSRRTLREALRQLKNLGHETYVVLSLVPNKVGLHNDAANFARQMSRDAEIVIAFHGRDEGADLSCYEELKQDYRSVEIPADQLGVLGLIANAGVTPFDWCAAPEPGFELAAAWTAQNLLKVAGQSSMARMLDAHLAVPVLSKLAQKNPAATYQNRTSRWQVCDACLTADAREITSQRAILRLQLDAPDSEVLAAARAFIAAAAQRRRAEEMSRAKYGT